MSIMKTHQYCFRQLPFYWRPLIPGQKNVLPATLPFNLFYDIRLGLLRQKPDAHLRKMLRSAYLSGSDVFGLMDERGIGYQYAADFLSFIGETAGLDNLKKKEVLEIGCGTGYLLHCLGKYGATVFGYEPGFAEIGKYDIPVARDFFPSTLVRNKRFHVIIGYGLLEHQEEPQKFLRIIKRYLQPNGILLLSVPDCEEHIRNGDISMLLHEHFSYFTRSSLQNLLQKSGYRVRILRKSSFGGGIYAAVEPAGSGLKESAGDEEESANFLEKVATNIDVLRNFFYQHGGKTVAVYVPIRALNLLYVLKDDLKRADIKLRFVDDSQNQYGKYLPGFKVRIENREELLKVPPGAVLIYSYSFGRQIAAELRKALSVGIPVYELREILAAGKTK